MGAASDIVDDIYEAAVVPETWPKVLEHISRVAGARGAVLLTANPEDVRWVSSAGIRDDTIAYVEGRWHERNGRLPRLLARQHAGFLREVDVFQSIEEYEQDLQVREFFHPRGLGFGAGMAIPVPSGDFLVFSIERERRNGPIEAEALPVLDSLRPSLARAAMMSARLGLERARAMAQALEAVGLPAAVLRRNGATYAANASFEALMPAVLRDQPSRLALADPSADALFAAGLARLAAAGKAPVLSVPIAADEARPPLIVHLLPVRGAAHDVFTQSAAIVVVTPVEPRLVPGAEVLQGLFDLTPAEARVARGIGEGRTVDEIAAAFSLSPQTVRSQLKTVLGKTGVRRQAELAALLAGNALPARASERNDG